MTALLDLRSQRDNTSISGFGTSRIATEQRASEYESLKPEAAPRTREKDNITDGRAIMHGLNTKSLWGIRDHAKLAASLPMFASGD